MQTETGSGRATESYPARHALRSTTATAISLAAVVLALSLLCISLSHAATLRVGPGEQITRIADAARLARDGDTVEILPGEYRGDVAVWHQKTLAIRGVGQRPVLIADGKNAEGKAIWVIRNGDFLIENIEFRGVRVSDKNGAGIRFERGKLEIRRCGFFDSESGLIASNFADSELTILDSEFGRNGAGDGQSHNLYAGRIAKLTIMGSRFHAANVGHLIKSRARRNDIRYNLIYDGPGGKASYEVDLPNGGIATLVGNIVGQSATTENPVVVSFGEEGDTWPENELTLVHNTLISDRLKGTWFLRVPQDKFRTPPSVRAWNNLTAGLGVFTLGASGHFRGNVPGLPFMLNDTETLDFGLPANSPLRLFAVDSRELSPEIIPKAEFSLPIGTRPLTPPEHWIPGALQRSP
jgi:hypothetical protein